MNRVALLSVFSVAALFSVGCSNRYDVNVAWTVDGFNAADICPSLTSPNVKFRLEQQDTQGGPVTEETQTAKCEDGAAKVSSASFSDLFIDVLSGDDVYGTTGPVHLTPGVGEYTGEEGAAPVTTNVPLERGRLTARFTVVGQDCGDAGASTITATLRHTTSILNAEVLVDSADVACSDGKATFNFEPVEKGSLYDFVATTSIGGVDYATTDEGSGGAGTVVDSAVTDLVVDLDAVGRP
jgi:hypothetical protein